MFARPELSTQVVVIATGTLPVAVPPDTSANDIEVGDTPTVRLSDRVAVSATLAVLEFNWLYPRAPKTKNHSVAIATPRQTHLIKYFMLCALGLRIEQLSIRQILLSSRSSAESSLALSLFA
jgi:hypothetical protein